MTTQNIIAKVLVFVSNVCRIEVTPELAKLAKPGITLIPDAVLAPRQIKLVEREPGDKFTFPATMKWHRDAFIPAVTREVADDLVARGEATYEEQSLLCYSMADYMADNHVKANADALAKAKAAAEEGADPVIVAVIGENRSPLAFARNVVSGCQKPEELEADAKGAIEAANVCLVE